MLFIHISVFSAVTVLCDAGSKRNPNTTPETCVMCEIGEYQDTDATNMTECTPCPPSGSGDNQTTEATGADSIDSCKSKLSSIKHLLSVLLRFSESSQLAVVQKITSKKNMSIEIIIRIDSRRK